MTVTSRSAATLLARNWVVASASGTVNLREEASPGAKVLVRHAPGYVALDFLTPAVSPDGSVRTGEDDSALRTARKGGELPLRD